MTPKYDKCCRTACKQRINVESGWYNIDNNGTVEGRDYCLPCGRKIVEYNVGIPHTVYQPSEKERET